MFADSHCHLNYSSYKAFLASKNVEYSEDYYSAAKIIERAKQANVKKFVTIGTHLSDVEQITKLAESFSNVFRTIGIYPDYAKEHLQKFSQNELREKFKKVCSHPKTVAIGEIGLDYHITTEEISEQKQIFRLQLGFAEEFGLPVSIHTRKAWQDTLDILDEFPKICAVIHCFSGEADFTERLLQTNYYIGVGGTITFKKNAELQESVKRIPLNRLLLETDAPFLAPVPYRGKINEPAFMIETAKKIAILKGVSLNELDFQTTQNFFNLFSKAM